MPSPKIIIVHPYDKTTIFLNKVVKSVLNKFDSDIIQINIEPDENSHVKCLEQLLSYRNNELVLFFGHGRSDKLFGAKADSFGKLFESQELVEEGDYNYYNDNFINQSNISVFRDKKVICLACNSNSDIAKYAVENGATTFAGFGDIPTSENEFENHGIIVGDKTVAIMKSKITQIMKLSLEISISSNYNFEEFQSVLALVTNNEISNLLIDNKGIKTRRVISDYLFKFKSELLIHGNRKLALI